MCAPRRRPGGSAQVAAAAGRAGRLGLASSEHVIVTRKLKLPTVTKQPKMGCVQSKPTKRRGLFSQQGDLLEGQGDLLEGQGLGEGEVVKDHGNNNKQQLITVSCLIRHFLSDIEILECYQ